MVQPLASPANRRVLSTQIQSGDNTRRGHGCKGGRGVTLIHVSLYLFELNILFDIES
jgi:hypothetical protein